MMMHSRRRIQMHGVVADAITANFLMPDNQIRLINAVVLGASNFGRVGKREVLDWPPQTVFAEFNQEFLHSELSLGYAKPLTLNGFLVKSHLIENARDRNFAFNLRHQQLVTISQMLSRWLAKEHHKHDDQWPTVTQQLQSAIEAYSNETLGLPQLLNHFEKAYQPLGPFQQQRVHDQATYAWAMVAKFDRTLDERLPPVWLLSNVQQVMVFQYSDARDIQIKSEPNDFERRNEPGYLQHMFSQVQVQKAEFKRLGLPFYDPEWLATKRSRDQPVWEPSSLKAYHL